ncbi:MAG: hypothetical protein DPW09_35590 [Anaerolineae bacterium]|nr:hypothetical protein [Anaerolineae bacterium]
MAEGKANWSPALERGVLVGRVSVIDSLLSVWAAMVDVEVADPGVAVGGNGVKVAVGRGVAVTTTGVISTWAIGPVSFTPPDRDNQIPPPTASTAQPTSHSPMAIVHSQRRPLFGGADLFSEDAATGWGKVVLAVPQLGQKCISLAFVC